MPASFPDLCWLGDRVQPLAEARISPLDRGFLFGDGVYESLKVLGGRPLFLRQHLARLDASLAGLAISRPAGLEAAIDALLAATGRYDGSLYLQVSRGAPASRTHRPPAGLPPTLFLLPAPLDFPDLTTAPGITAVSCPDWRWRRCDLKATSLAGAVLGLLEAERAGADEVLWVGGTGELREGGHTNVFVFRRGVLESHASGPEILSGVTRAHLVELAAGLGLAVVARAPSLAERDSWEELLVCGTLTGVRGVVSLDGARVADGGVGPRTRALAAALAAREREEAAA